MTLNSFNAFTVTVTPQSILWKYKCESLFDELFIVGGAKLEYS